MLQMKAPGKRRCVDPGAVALPHLQAGHAVGREQRDVAVVGVRAGADLSDRRIGARHGIVQQAQGGLRTIDLVGEEVLLKAQVHREGRMECASDRQHRVEVALHDRLEARQVRPDVGGPVDPVGPDQVEGFLEVGSALLVERLDAGPT